MVFMIIFSILIVLAALFPMLYDVSWNVKVALVFFFFSYPVARYTGIVGLLMMWGTAAAFLTFFPMGEVHGHDQDRQDT